MYATGRLPRTRDLGLEALGVKLGVRGEIVVDEYSQSSVPGVHAIGDVTDRIALTPVALHEAMCLSARCSGARRPSRTIATCQLASSASRRSAGRAHGGAGARALRRGGHLPLALQELKHTLSGRDQQAMMKLVVDRRATACSARTWWGATRARSSRASRLRSAARRHQGQFDATLGIHPTSAEEFVTMRERVKA